MSVQFLTLYIAKIDSFSEKNVITIINFITKGLQTDMTMNVIDGFQKHNK